jgi:hypothetical protein
MRTTEMLTRACRFSTQTTDEEEAIALAGDVDNQTNYKGKGN